MGFPEGGDEGHGDDIGDRRWQADRDLTAERRFTILCARPDLVELCAYARRMLEHLAALLRQDHATPVPCKERNAQLFLEHANLAAQRRLGNP